MSIPDLTLRQLRAVRTLAQSGSFTKAAAAEHISQSVLSRLGAVGDEAGDGAVGVGKAAASVGPVR
ncbi:LysR family transcriptional regulator [Streptomyces sp. Inha503]|uniref:LysR family transcriptional regulator n=1 Tax=Streptomyces sp. Inha503 TaxID=3383314 RepID=UPI0039A00F94